MSLATDREHLEKVERGTTYQQLTGPQLIERRTTGIGYIRCAPINSMMTMSFRSTRKHMVAVDKLRNVPQRKIDTINVLVPSQHDQRIND